MMLPGKKNESAQVDPGDRRKLFFSCCTRSENSSRFD